MTVAPCSLTSEYEVQGLLLAINLRDARPCKGVIPTPAELFFRRAGVVEHLFWRCDTLLIARPVRRDPSPQGRGFPGGADASRAGLPWPADVEPFASGGLVSRLCRGRVGRHSL